MFKATLLISFLFLSSAFAANPIYKLNINLTLNGKPAASRSLLAHDGEKSEIVQKVPNGSGTFIEVTPEEIDGELKTIHLKFVVGTLVKGVKQILSTPEMIVEEGKEGSIEIGDKNDPAYLSMTVLANRHSDKK